MIRPLIGIPSPRDIPDFADATSKLPADKLWIKYHGEREAYRVMRKMFLGAKKYTHLAILPDDLIATPHDYEILMKDIEEFDYPLIAGTCNLLYNDPRYITCKKLPLSYMNSAMFLIPPEELFTGEPIKQVEFDGFAFTFIRRDIVKQIEFHSKLYSSTAFDNAFAEECKIRGIPMRVDVRAKMLHLANRLGNGSHENMGFGLKSTLKFEPYSN
jgi:hypothetical protein